MQTHVVIMAGGIGSRFWPMSTPEYPKQFIDVMGCGKSLIQLTVERFLSLCPIENFWVVTSEKYTDIVKTQLPELTESHILAEPEARNTAPCIAYACWKIKKEFPEANIVVTPSDALVINTAEFARCIAVALESQAGLVLDPGFMFRFTCIVSLVTGTMFLMWLGEQITERGLGNGISIIIFAGIVAGLPSAISGLFQLVSTGAISPLSSIFVIAIVALVTAFVVFIERGQRRITVNYAKRQVGNRLYGGQTSYLPLKMNMSGVIPPIFASSLILFPATLAGWFTSGDSTRWIRDLAAALSPGQPLYTLLYAAMIVFFAYFYTALVFNPRETAENLKKSGAFVPGIRPGEQTSRYIDKVLLRLTLGGAIYLVFVCLVPEFLNMRFNVPFYFGGTSLLIVVVVTMDFMSQVQAYMMSQQYENLLKKTNFKGFGSAGM